MAQIDPVKDEKRNASFLPPSNRDARFYQPELLASRIPPAFVTLLESYSKIPAANQVSHIVRIRDQAYANYPYPCLGRFRILDLDLAAHPLYGTVLEILRGSTAEPIDQALDDPNSTTSSAQNTKKPILLDLGTCLGQDIRKLIYDGVSPNQIYGADLNDGFVDFGYALFRDEDILPRSQFLTGEGCNVLLYPGQDATSLAQNSITGTPTDEESQLISNQNNRPKGLNDLRNSIDVIHACAIFHLFALDDQKKIARSCLRLLRKNDDTKPAQDRNNSYPSKRENGINRKLILGAQAGNINAAESQRRDGTRVYRHNEASWERMWLDVVGESEWEQLDTKVEVGSMLVERAFVGTDKNQEEGDGKVEWNSKVVGRAEDGVRWHVFWVWVQFGSS